MQQQNRNTSQPLSLSRDQKFLLDFYISQFNETNTSINLLYNNLDTYRLAINQITSGILPSPPPAHTQRSTRNNRSNYTTTSSFSDPETEFISLPVLLTELFNSFTNSVPIVATQTQIDAATRVLLYSEINNPINTSCPISLNRFSNNSRVTQICNCSHIFDTDAINTWFSSNVLCPVCRYDIRSQNINNTSNNSRNNTSNNASNNTSNNANESNRSNSVPQNINRSRNSSRRSENNSVNSNINSNSLFNLDIEFERNLTNNNIIDASNNLLYEPYIHNVD